MRCTMITGMLYLMLGVLGGCSIAGTWRVQELSIEGDQAGVVADIDFGLETITFSSDHRYTATTDGPDRHTQVGRYQYNGRLLILVPDLYDRVTYSARMKSSNVLELTHVVADQKIIAKLQHTGE